MGITISVVIPAYNAGGYLARAIDSVLAQSRPAEEIVVVDDGSSDNTAQVAQGYGEKIRFIRQENAGASVARNTGIEAATSEWIAFLDADDEWLGNHLLLHSQLLERNPQLAWTTGNFYRCRCDRDHERHQDMNPQRLAGAERLLAGKEYFESYFAAHAAYAAGCTDTILVKRQALYDAGLFLVGLGRINDVDMWFRVAYNQRRIGFVAEPTAIYHMGVPESIIKMHKDPGIICDFAERHLALSAEYNCTEDIKPCLAKMVGWWIKCMLDEKRGPEVRKILRKYGWLFNRYCRTTTYIRAILPRTSLVYETLRNTLLKRNR